MIKERSAMPVLTRAIIEAEGGPVDCRVEACVILGFPFDHPFRHAETPITFDPAAPLLPPPDAVVDAASAVRDGDTLSVTGSNYYPYSSLLAALCAPAPADIKDCDGGGAYYDETHSDEWGTISKDIVAVARFTTERGRTVDCRIDACEMAVFNFFYRGGFLEGPPISQSPVEFDPASALLAPAEAQAAPTEDLAQTDTVDVTGSGFRVLTGVDIVQCPITDPLSYRDCDWSHQRYVQHPPDGQIDVAFTVHRTFESQPHLDGTPRTTTDCLVTECAVVVSDFRGENVFIFPLRFDETISDPGTPGPPALARPMEPQFTG